MQETEVAGATKAFGQNMLQVRWAGCTQNSSDSKGEIPRVCESAGAPVDTICGDAAVLPSSALVNRLPFGVGGCNPGQPQGLEIARSARLGVEFPHGMT